jgi:hypothetical protein
MYDRVNVDLPYTVTIGDHTLQPGNYVIQQLHGEGGERRVLLIYSDSGMKFETSAMTIPTVDMNTPEDTKVVLHHYGPEYYFDKIWIQGKNYGYEFPLPDSVKARERERMQPISVAAQYQAVPPQAETTAQSTETTTVTPVTPPAEPQTTTESQTTTMAQNTPPPAEATPAPPQENTANREMDESQKTNTMPATSAGWLMMLLGGGALSGAGMMLRRKR